MTTRGKLGLSDDALIVMQVGRPGPFKGTDKAIRAVGALRGLGVDAALLLVGGVVDEQWLGSRVKDHQAESWIVATGPVDESQKSDLLRLADVLVVVSDYEAFGFVALEALVHGCAVISYDDFPSSDLLAGLGGLLVRREEGDQGIVKRLREFMSGAATRVVEPEPDGVPTWGDLTEMYSNRARLPQGRSGTLRASLSVSQPV
jgi:glycosyltransferase involved in cell wall biosynthesis